MSEAYRDESVVYTRPAALPGTELLLAQRCTRLWHVFHERYVICAGRNGSTDWRYRSKTHYQAGPAGYMLMEPGESHRNLTMRGLPDFSTLFIDPAMMLDAAHELGLNGTPHLRLAQDNRPGLCRALTALVRAVKTDASPLEQQSRLAVCVRLLVDHYLERTPPSSGVAAAGRAAVERAKTMLWDRFNDTITLDELAAAAGCSRFHLLRTFAQHTGLPPHAYQIRVRVERSRRLLANGVPISVAALNVGFADQSHFTRHFKRIMRVTPSRYALA